MAEIERLVSVGPWSLAQFLSSCRSEREQVRVAQEDSGTILGFAVFSQVLDEGTLLNIAVHPRRQGAGLGRVLLNDVLAGMRTAGCVRCLLEVRAGNAPAIAMYRAIGFCEDGVRRQYYPALEGREDALLMSLSLTEKA